MKAATRAQKPYTAWQYFLLFCDDGTKIAGALAEEGRGSELWLSVYGPEQSAFDIFFPRQAYNLSPRGCSLRANFLLKDKDRAWLRVAEQGIELEVSGRSVIDWPDNRLALETAAGRVDWQVPFLRLEFQGHLTVNGKKRAIRGLMFHDAVSHTLQMRSPSLLTSFRSWTWGLLYSGDRTIMFVDVRYQAKPFRFVCVAGPEGIISSSAGKPSDDVHISYEGRYPHEQVRLEFGGEPVIISLLKRHPVFHGGAVGKLLMRLFKPKFHSSGVWRQGEQAGEAYIESLRLR